MASAPADGRGFTERQDPVPHQRPSSSEALESSVLRSAAAGAPALVFVSRRGVLRVLPGIAAAAMTGLLLTGCGGDDEDDEDDEDDDD